MKSPTTHIPGRDLHARLIPDDWMRSPRHRPNEARHTPVRGRWLTTLPAPLADVRDTALQALRDMDTELAYLYEAENKVVIRSSLEGREIRAEFTPIDRSSTRVVVVTLHDGEVDRATSNRVIQSIESALEAIGYNITG
ncbi:MAG: hypothetical protein IT531_17200 [Burkholderiales bacterium]|nr:hypothetical protein [Burkholderiales bacterium]